MTPFSTIRISSMAACFQMSLEEMEQEVANIIIEYRNSILSSNVAVLTSERVIETPLLDSPSRQPTMQEAITFPSNTSIQQNIASSPLMEFETSDGDVLREARIDSHEKIIHIGIDSVDKEKAELYSRAIKEAKEYCQLSKRIQLRASLLECKDLIVR